LRVREPTVREQSCDYRFIRMVQFRQFIQEPNHSWAASGRWAAEDVRTASRQRRSPRAARPYQQNRGTFRSRQTNRIGALALPTGRSKRCLPK